MCEGFFLLGKCKPQERMAVFSLPIPMIFLRPILLCATLAGALIPNPVAGQIELRPNGPISTPAAARDAARQARKPVKIIVQQGTYELAEPLVLTPEDSGVTWECAKDARVVFSGGHHLPAFQMGKDGVWEVNLGKGDSFDQLWINGRRATPARFPDRGFLLPQRVEELQTSENAARHVVTFRPEDLAPLRNRGGNVTEQLQLLATHKWDNTRRRVLLIDFEKGEVVTEGTPFKKHNPWDQKTAFQFQHVPGIGAPGEWVLSRDRVLRYRPLPGETPEKSRAVVPRLQQLLILRGTPEKKVQEVAFRGISFQHTGWVCPEQGFEPQQAAASIEGVIQADHVRDVMLKDCEVKHTGIYGMWFRSGCQGVTIQHCLVGDTGAGGVRFGTMLDPVAPAEETSHNKLENSIIQDGGHVFPCAVGVWIGQSADNKITHNEIGWQSYSGMSIGWRWGYAPSVAKRNVIEFNHIHHIGDGILSDMGAVYTLGPSEGTVIRNNHIHHVIAREYGGWGLYNDEGSTGILMENNLVTHTHNGGYHQHYGRENIIRNNIFAFATLSQLQFTRVEKHLSFHFDHNIILWREGSLFAGGGWAGQYEMDHNLFHRMGGKGDPDFAGNTFAAWQAGGHDQNSLCADPEFRSPEKGDWSFSIDSPARKIGFVPFDPKRAGVNGEAAWIKLAAQKPEGSRYPELERK